MLTKSQALKMFNDGNIDEVVNEVRRYGKIVSDTKWIETEGFYAGDNRLMVLSWHGMRWEIEMRDGDIKMISHKSE